MVEGITKNGKAYLRLTEDEVKKLPPKSRVFDMQSGGVRFKAIPPLDCKHELLTRETVDEKEQIARNICECAHCILWLYEWEATSNPKYAKLIKKNN